LSEKRSGLSQTILALDRKYGLFRAVRFGIAGIVGFLVAEVIIVVGLYAIYRSENVSSEIYTSTTLLGLNILAFVIGVTVGFFINERITVRNRGAQKLGGATQVGIRLLKYQGVYALGNAITIGVQLALLRFFSLAPAVGNIIGAIVAFPVSYVISMRVVWRINSATATNASEKDGVASTDPDNKSKLASRK
jgi:putative flippase GtrA